MDVPNKKGKTPLESTHATFLLDFTDQYENNPLHWAAKQGQLSFFHAFFLFTKERERLDATLTQQNDEKETPLIPSH